MPPQTSTNRVLIVDDDEMSRELLAVLLAAEGYAVEAADSGEAALALLQQAESAPDLVLADIQLPGISGARLAGELRSACGPATLLLAISGSQPAEEAISSFDGFLLKPFKMSEIAVWMERGREPADVTGPTGAALEPKPASTYAPAPGTASNRNMENGMQAMQEQTAETIQADLTGGPILNENIYRQLTASMPAPQLLEMYTMCVDDALERIARMRRLAAAGDEAQFVREAHAIKGGCGMLGATELHRMASVLEKYGLQALTSGGAPEVNSLDELAGACGRLERMLGSRV